MNRASDFREKLGLAADEVRMAELPPIVIM
jgi:hypothetical protein